jgi:RNA polymerase sigma factor (sigma-70 family)
MDFQLYSPTRASLPQLIKVAQADPDDDSVAMNQIVRRFDPLARGLSRITDDRYLQDDLANAARMALVRAVRRHDGRHDTFPAFAKVSMRGAVLRELEWWRTQARPLQVEAEIDQSEVTPQPGPEEEVVARLAPWGAGRVASTVAELAPVQHRIVHLRYVEDERLETIAAVMGTTASAVSQRLCTIHRAVERALAA